MLILKPPGTRLQFGQEQPADVLTPGTLRKRDALGLLIGLNTEADETLGLASLEGVSEDGSWIIVKTPLQDLSGVRILQLGSVRLHEMMGDE